MDAAAIEQANKLRKAIGLAPLPVPGASNTTSEGPAFKEHSSSDDSDDEPASTLETREAAGFANFQKIQDDLEAKKRREAKAVAIKRARDAAQKFVKLEGKGLGDVDDGGDLDAKAWLKGQSKRQKRIEKERVRRMEEDLAERERLAALDYAAEDLAGVRVGHEVGEFDEAEGEQVLTLKDTTIDENEEEGDELENINLREREKLKERLDLKKRRPVYDPNAINETGERNLLSQYDEDIDGKKRKRFTLDGQGATVEEREAKRQEVGDTLRAMPISLDILKEQSTSDYMDISEVKIKKPKKAKKKSTRQKAADEDDIFPANEETNGFDANQLSMEVDGAPLMKAPNANGPETSFVDNEDLEAALAAQRRAAFKKRKRQRPEDIARQIQEEASTTPQNMALEDQDEDDEPGLVIDETSEFVANLQRPTLPEQKIKPTLQPSIEVPTNAHDSDDDGDVNMNQAYTGVEDEDEPLASMRREKSTGTPDRTATGLEEEATLDQGVGAALAMLRDRHIVQTTGMGDINAIDRDRQRFLREKHRREAEAEHRARLQRERDRASGKLDRMSAREREEYARWENKQRDTIESRQMADKFNREYKPNVQLKYIDEFGRSMDPKEAFKQLSHQFHGKGSGKQKTEKHLKKIDDEKKREAASALDSSQATGMHNAMGTTAKKNKQAGVRLA